MLFLYLLLIHGVTSLSLQPVGADLGSLNLLEKIQASPKEFIAEMAALDPEKLRIIINLLKDLRGSSEETEEALEKALSDAQDVTQEASQDVANAEEAKRDADAAVTAAETNLANVIAAEKANVGRADGILTGKREEQALAQAKVETKVAEHGVTVKTEAHKRKVYETMKPTLDGEQAILEDVIRMLKGLHATNDYVLLAQTGTVHECESDTGVTVAFKVNGQWTGEMNFFDKVANGASVSQTFSLSSKPSDIRYTSPGSDGWCYVKSTLTKGHSEASVVFADYGNSVGEEYGNNKWWVDGNQEAPPSNSFSITWPFKWADRVSQQQCIAASAPYPGDVDHNPFFGNVGLPGVHTLDECKRQCASRVDAHDRACVAIEWADGGVEHAADVKKWCGLTWGCDSFSRWTGGSSFRVADV